MSNNVFTLLFFSRVVFGPLCFHEDMTVNLKQTGVKLCWCSDNRGISKLPWMDFRKTKVRGWTKELIKKIWSWYLRATRCESLRATIRPVTNSISARAALALCGHLQCSLPPPRTSMSFHTFNIIMLLTCCMSGDNKAQKYIKNNVTIIFILCL